MKDMEVVGLPPTGEQFRWIEDLFKELRRLGCYDIKFEKDSKFHKESSAWFDTISSNEIITGNPLPNHILGAYRLKGIWAEIVDRSLEKETFKNKEDEGK